MSLDYPKAPPADEVGGRWNPHGRVVRRRIAQHNAKAAGIFEAWAEESDSRKKRVKLRTRAEKLRRCGEAYAAESPEGRVRAWAGSRLSGEDLDFFGQLEQMPPEEADAFIQSLPVKSRDAVLETWETLEKGVDLRTVWKCGDSACARCMRDRSSEERRRMRRALEARALDLYPQPLAERATWKERDAAIVAAMKQWAPRWVLMTLTQDSREGEPLADAMARVQSSFKRLQTHKAWKTVAVGGLVTWEVTASTPKRRAQLVAQFEEEAEKALAHVAGAMSDERRHALERMRALHAQLRGDLDPDERKKLKRAFKKYKARAAAEDTDEARKESWERARVLTARAKRYRAMTGVRWHAHAHLLVEVEPIGDARRQYFPRLKQTRSFLPQKALLRMWAKASGFDAHDPARQGAVWVAAPGRRRTGAYVKDPRKVLGEVVKYFSKPSDLRDVGDEHLAELLAWKTGRRTRARWGTFLAPRAKGVPRGTPEPEARGDEPPQDDRPFPSEVEQGMAAQAVAKKVRDALDRRAIRASTGVVVPPMVPPRSSVAASDAAGISEETGELFTLDGFSWVASDKVADELGHDWARKMRRYRKRYRPKNKAGKRAPKPM